MIPSRGLWRSSQTIGIGRRRIEILSARQFSSTVQNSPIRNISVLSKNGGVSNLEAYARIGFSRTSRISRNGAGIRFASTTPLQTNPSSTSLSNPSISTTTPAEAVGSTSSSPSEIPTLSLDKATDLTSDGLYGIPEHIGYLKSLGLEYGWGPTSVMEWTLEHVHILTGTPWWVSITLTAILVRAVLFKPYIDAAENTSKMAAIKHITGPISAKMTAASRSKDTNAVMQLRGELSMIHKRAGITMWKSFVPMLQIFAGYGTFVLLRGMAKLPVPGLETGGALWFYNLTIPDPFFVFPVATATVLHWVLRKGGETGVSTLSPVALTAMMWGLPALTLIFTWWLPAALQLSFFVAGFLSFAQASLFRVPAFRKFFDMTPLPTPAPGGKSSSPYKGSMNIRTSLPQPPQAQGRGFAEGKSARMQVLDAAIASKLPGAIKPVSEAKKSSVLDGAIKDVMGTYQSAKQSFSELTQKGKKGMDDRRQRSEREAARKYEEKRQMELKSERWQQENKRRAERAAKRLKGR